MNLSEVQRIRKEVNLSLPRVNSYTEKVARNSLIESSSCINSSSQPYRRKLLDPMHEDKGKKEKTTQVAPWAKSSPRRLQKDNMMSALLTPFGYARKTVVLVRGGRHLPSVFPVLREDSEHRAHFTF